MKLLLPYRGIAVLTSPYGSRTLNGVPDIHHGIDLVGQSDKTILAPCAGTVGASACFDPETDTTRTWEWGNYVRIDAASPDTDTSVYLCHLSERWVRTGQFVNAGDAIGLEGNTGYSFGSHLHLEVRKNGTPVNPCAYLDIENTADPLTENPAENKKTGSLPHEWAEDAVAWAVENGVLLGSDPNQPDYRLHDPITREEAVTLLWRTMKNM